MNKTQRLIFELLKAPISAKAISDYLGISKRSVQNNISVLRKEHRISSIPGDETLYMLEDDVKSLKKQEIQDLIQKIQAQGYFVTKGAQKSDYDFNLSLDPFKGDEYKIGIVSDTHLGSRFQQLTHLHTFYKMCQEEGIDTIFHCGDIIDGERVYKGHEYERFLHGADAQLEYARDNYPQEPGVRTVFIGGNHDESLWKLAGMDIGKRLSAMRKDMVYKGFNGAYFSINNIKKFIYIHHGRGGVAYARSYKIQKLIEQLSADQKPQFMFEGHFHCSCWLPNYQDVSIWQMPCFQTQTPYLKARGLRPEVGGLILEFKITDKPVVLRSEFIPFYKSIQDDF
jgi:predicted phosphodiesterase